MFKKTLMSAAPCGAALAMLMAIAAPAHAGLTGTTVSLDAFFPDLTSPIAGGSAVVGPGIEFPQGGALEAVGYRTDEDVGDDYVSVNFNHPDTSSYTNTAFNGFRFTFTTVVPTSATLDVTSGFAPQTIQLIGNQLYLNFAGVDPVPANSFSRINLGFGAANGGVPEPASWAMMLVGFGGLGAALRRRRTLAAAA